MNDEQSQIRALAENLTATLDAVVPRSTIHYAVENARRALTVLAKQAPTIITTTSKVWTFFGHWHSGQIVVDYVEPGVVQDDRRDAGYPEGLWAASAWGDTVELAEADAIAEYVTDPEGLRP